MPQVRRESVAFTVVVTVSVLVGAALLATALAAGDAPGRIPLAVALAALPIGPVLAVYLWVDRYEPEPKQLLLAGLLWGAFVATVSAVTISGIGGMFVRSSDQQSLTVVAPVVEEATKGLFLFLLLWWRRAELDGILDGVVYAGMVGIGFAFTENILYLLDAAARDAAGAGGGATLTGTFILRCLFSPFAHPLFTAFTGIGIGLAVAAKGRGSRWLAPVVGYAVAVLAHAVWNASTLFGFGGFVLVYSVLMVPVFVGVASLLVWTRSAERRVLTAALQDAAQRGLIPATDIGWVVDLTARRRARRHARDFGGPDAAAAMADFQQAAIELGFLHHRLLRGTPPRDWQARGQEFVTRIQAARPRFAFPGQVVPQL